MIILQILTIVKILETHKLITWWINILNRKERLEIVIIEYGLQINLQFIIILTKVGVPIPVSEDFLMSKQILAEPTSTST